MSSLEKACEPEGITDGDMEEAAQLRIKRPGWMHMKRLIKYQRLGENSALISCLQVAGHLDTEDTLKLTRSENDVRWHYECRHWMCGGHHHPVYISEPLTGFNNDCH